ncbi:MAG: hypothetical protein WCG02_02910 [Candidatus Taylorbacteria bacterium]
METEINKLKSLLEEKKFDEVKKIIEDVAKQPMSDEEKAAAAVGVASIYMETVNQIGEEYRESLKEILVGLERINKAQGEAEDRVKIAEVRNSLATGQ